MGGDHGPKVTVPAALAFANSVPDVEMVLVGRETLVRAELDKAFGLSPEVVKKLDDLFGKDAMMSASQAGRARREAAGVLGAQDIRIAWPNARAKGVDVKGVLSDAVVQSGASSWVENKYPEDAAARRTFQIRVQRALHDTRLSSPGGTWTSTR